MEAPAPKPNPLGKPAMQSGEDLLRQAVAIDRSMGSPHHDETASPACAPNAPKRVDTSALTGLRGLAAFQVAAGHIFMASDLQQDLIGGAAMPFFYLLSGFVMTLGYGQTLYESPNTVCSKADSQGKVMDKGKFWRNRFARLFPVYAVTNLIMAGLIIAMGGAGIDGSPQGVLGMLLQLSLACFGLNTWFYPFADVGMPPNGVCWTICTMSFFYWVFPFILPAMQRMTTDSRRRWVVWFFLLQLLTYAATYTLWSSVVPILQMNPNDFDDPLGEWRAGLDFSVSQSMGYWVARSWPGFRIMVFVMGCLAALNRLEVAKRQVSSNKLHAFDFFE
jgi:peptidoglycan/LPS O-acetylase OafA/YrhL